MFNTLIIKWVAAALLAAAFSTGIYFLYAHIKGIGYQEAVAVYTKRDELAKEQLHDHIVVLETLSKSVVDNNAAYLGKLDKDIKTILLTVKDKTPYVIVNGKCTPSPEYIDTYNKIIRKANE